MKRVPELRDLSDVHHTGLVLARRCKEVRHSNSELSPEQLWKQVLEVFSSDLEPHFQIEERYLLPALEAIGENSLAERVREDHRALRGLRDSEPITRALVGEFGELLDSHIRYEEREVFEFTQDRLPTHALQAIESACRARRGICHASPEA